MGYFPAKRRRLTPPALRWATLSSPAAERGWEKKICHAERSEASILRRAYWRRFFAPLRM